MASEGSIAVTVVPRVTTELMKLPPASVTLMTEATSNTMCVILLHFVLRSLQGGRK